MGGHDRMKKEMKFAINKLYYYALDIQEDLDLTDEEMLEILDEVSGGF